jgi:hypothetical protein
MSQYNIENVFSIHNPDPVRLQWHPNFPFISCCGLNMDSEFCGIVGVCYRHVKNCFVNFLRDILHPYTSTPRCASDMYSTLARNMFIRKSWVIYFSFHLSRNKPIPFVHYLFVERDRKLYFQGMRMCTRWRRDQGLPYFSRKRKHA